MYALYDENGDFKVGTILSEADASLAIEAQHGKRSKVKASHVLLRFRDPTLDVLLPQANAVADAIDVDFLWEASGDAEFGFQALAEEYFGRAPTAVEATGILLKLHSAPIYFHRKGRGRYRAAPQETVKAALAGLEKKRRQQEKMAEWVATMQAGSLPSEIVPHVREILYRPDRNKIETKAVEQAASDAGLTVPKLLEHIGGLGSSHDYHLGRFLYEYFPRGTEAAPVEVAVPPDLPVADVRAFSLDDASTTEIDDAFSLATLDDGTLRLGIHIAAPALGFDPASPAAAIARDRLSTVYMPGSKITMLPESVVDAFTLAEGGARPAASLYVDLDPATWAIRQHFSRLERVPVAANLRHQDVEHLNAAFESATDEPVTDVPFAAELRKLYQLALVLEGARTDAGQGVDRTEYSFHVIGDRIEITERRRGSPLDKLVAELMILVNRTWGRFLADNEAPAIYRVQSQGKVRMTTTPGEHQGLGVSHYAWSSSPLRRYVDLVNQWQLVAVLAGNPLPFQRNDASLLAAMRDFELTYAGYAEFQQKMEHYWCLRWLVQEAKTQVEGTLVRENVVKFRDLPLYVRVPSLPELTPGTNIVLEVRNVDLVDATVDAVYKSRVGAKSPEQSET